MSPRVVLIGADGCPGAWMVACQPPRGPVWVERASTARLAQLCDRPWLRAAVLDIPIGLTASGPRDCDIESRRLLGRRRGTSVFPAPLRSMLGAGSHAEAQRIRLRIEGRGLSRQAHGIIARVAEVDRLLDQPWGARLHEGHPELAFRELMGGGLPASKHSLEGRRQRWELLLPHFQGLPHPQLESPGSADLLDSLACLWTARRLLSASAGWVPVRDQLDPMRLRPMRIWY